MGPLERSVRRGRGRPTRSYVLGHASRGEEDENGTTRPQTGAAFGQRDQIRGRRTHRGQREQGRQAPVGVTSDIRANASTTRLPARRGGSSRPSQRRGDQGRTDGSTGTNTAARDDVGDLRHFPEWRRVSLVVRVRTGQNAICSPGKARASKDGCVRSFAQTRGRRPPLVKALKRGGGCGSPSRA